MTPQLVVKVFTDKGLCLEKSAVYCRLPGKSGDIGITSGHTASLLACGVGEVVVKTSKNDHGYFMSSSIAHIENNNVTILTNFIEAIENIDKSRALASKERAEKRLADAQSGRADSDIDITRARSALGRAETRLEILSKYSSVQ